MLKILCFALAVVAVTATAPKHWALLVAGSNGWWNYRHQADVCHAYQIMKKNGIPDENIIVMMYDDIAYNKQNPTPGIIINRPNGPDVYHGVPKDYTGKDVNPDTFLKVLTGDEAGLRAKGVFGKVIKSGPQDHIFVNFVDHGAPGLVAFPDGILHAKQLQKAYMQMYKDKKYGKMVFYIEACESGSMFYKLLPDNINVFATTAANRSESSWGCYCHTSLVTCLGDLYSVNWMQDSDKEDVKTETLHKQYEIVKEETNKSHVQEFGDLSIGQMVVGAFQGECKDGAVFDKGVLPDPRIDAVRSEDVPLAILQHQLRSARTIKDRVIYAHKIELLGKRRQDIVELMTHIVSRAVNWNFYKSQAIMTDWRDLTNHDCYSLAVDTLAELCPGLNLFQDGFALRQLHVLVNLCEEPTPYSSVMTAIEDVTRYHPICHSKNRV